MARCGKKQPAANGVASKGKAGGKNKGIKRKNKNKQVNQPKATANYSHPDDRPRRSVAPSPEPPTKNQKQKQNQGSKQKQKQNQGPKQTQKQKQGPKQTQGSKQNTMSNITNMPKISTAMLTKEYATRSKAHAPAISAPAPLMRPIELSPGVVLRVESSSPRIKIDTPPCRPGSLKIEPSLGFFRSTAPNSPLTWRNTPTNPSNNLTVPGTWTFPGLLGVHGKSPLSSQVTELENVDNTAVLEPAHKPAEERETWAHIAAYNEGADTSPSTSVVAQASDSSERDMNLGDIHPTNQGQMLTRTSEPTILHPQPQSQQQSTLQPQVQLPLIPSETVRKLNLIEPVGPVRMVLPSDLVKDILDITVKATQSDQANDDKSYQVTAYIDVEGQQSTELYCGTFSSLFLANKKVMQVFGRDVFQLMGRRYADMRFREAGEPPSADSDEESQAQEPWTAFGIEARCSSLRLWARDGRRWSYRVEGTMV
ncbi:hypothetical protein F4780DRAFT_765931 [Xylariomycetidae sp. FL0641]|nr:hypothetical protein F4780DRAFT_765931 [Xylariomycetidae sp. FL0641]